MQAASKRCKTARKHALRHGMATANSAPHRHTHPSLTRTRRPKKLPPTRSLPVGKRELFRIVSFVTRGCSQPLSLFQDIFSPLLHAVCHYCRSHATRIPRFFSPFHAGRTGTIASEMCNLKAWTHFHMRSILGAGKSRYVEPPALDLTKPVPCRRCLHHHALHLPLDSRGVSSMMPRATEPHPAPLTIDAPNPQEQTATHSPGLKPRMV
jgi:hypothetical protein